MWHNRSRLPADRSPRPPTRCSRAARRRPPDRGLRRRVDRVRRQPVRRLAGHRPLPHLPLRRGRAVGRRALPHAAPTPRTAAIMGKSSGGFGAMITPMLRPDLFGGARHATRATRCTRTATCRSFAAAVRALRDATTARTSASGRTSGRGRAITKPDDGDLVMTYGVAACFSADDDGTVQLPFDPATGRLVDDVWAALAGLGSGAHGARVRRRAARAAGDLDRRRQARRVVPRSRRRGLPARARGRSASRRRVHSSCSTPRTAASTTATRCPSPGLSTG